MKKIITAITLVATMAACNTAPNPAATTTTTTTTTAALPDTAGLAAYQAWKAQNELVNANPNMNNGVAMAPAASPTRSYAPARSYSSSSTRRSSSSSRSSSGGSYSSGSSNTASAPVATRKKGWSKAAKGAVIGGVVGAGAGAIINKKNRGAGAVIGGILGAAGGYGIGRGQDKKDGRY